MTLRGNLEAHVFSAIKVLTARMVQDCGKYEGVAMLLGRRPSQLHDWGNVTMPTCIPADVLLQLEQARMDGGHRPLLLAFIASKLGHLLVPATAQGGGDIGRAVGDMWRELAEFAAAHGEAQADGEISAREAEDLIAPLDDAAAQIAALRNALAARAARREVRMTIGGGGGGSSI